MTSQLASINLPMTRLYEKYSQADKCTVIGLLNNRGELVSAIYTEALDCEKVSILDLCNSQINEKYFIVMNGIAVYFSSLKKLN